MEPTHSVNTCNHAAIPQTSQLCKPLAAILRDLGTLSMLEYFIQYMEEQGALRLLQFWFAVESFKIAAPSPKHATDYSRQLTTSGTSTYDKQCHVAASVETDVNSRMSRQTVTIEEGSNLECNVDALLPYLNPTCVNNDTVSNTDEGNGDCINNNNEGRKNMCDANSSDTLEGQREPEPAANGDVATPSPTEGIHVHQRLLKQLSLSKEVCIWWFTSDHVYFG